MAQLPKISVITPSYNQARFIRQTIDSVLAQNYPNFEHIVMDGGSTDGTQEVLKSYPHLTWISEKDRGQSHAINKALALTTGDIIAWINSDDWYAPGTFAAVELALREHPVVMGACEIVKGDGTPEYVTQNIQRGWFDILKYWVPYSIPTQPSIFFRKEVIDRARNASGAIIDESIHYCMDYDLWLRFWDEYPARAIPQVFSYYRMYEDNKTGQGMAPLIPELSKVYRIYAGETGAPLKFSYIVPLSSSNEALISTLNSIFQSTTHPSEIILCAGRESENSAILNSVANPKNISIRFEKSAGNSFDEMVQTGFIKSTAPLCVVLNPGAMLSDGAPQKLIEIFEKDSVGGALLDGTTNHLAMLFDHSGQINLGALVQERHFGFPIAIRRAAVHDLAGIRCQGNPVLAIREMLFRLRFKGWDVQYAPASVSYRPEVAQSFEDDDEFVGVFGNYINAQIVCDIARELAGDPFAKHRINMGSGVCFTPEVVGMCEEILKNAPQKWYQIDYSNPGELLRLQEFYPRFAPSYFYQAKIAARQDRYGDSQKALAIFERERAAERDAAQK